MNRKEKNMVWDTFSRRHFLKGAYSSMIVIAGSGLFLNSCRPKNYFTTVNPAWRANFEFSGDSMLNQIIEIIRFSSLAPSGHNTQPWLFVIDNDVVKIQPDFSRCLPIADPDNRELFISLGCAVENFVIAAEAAGFGCDVEIFPEGGLPDCISIKLSKINKIAVSDLFKAIPLRHTNRSEYFSQIIPTEDLRFIEGIGLQPKIHANYITDKGKFAKFIDLVKSANEIQMNSGAYMRELISWIRFSDDEAAEFMDGLTSRAMGIAPVPGWIGRFYMKVASGPKSQSREDEKKIKSSSGLGFIYSETDDKYAWIETGRSFERLALTLTGKNLKNALVNAPIQVKKLRKEISTISGVQGFAQLGLRIGYAGDLPHSPRRGTESIIKSKSGNGK